MTLSYLLYIACIKVKSHKDSKPYLIQHSLIFLPKHPFVFSPQYSSNCTDEDILTQVCVCMHVHTELCAEHV